MTVFSDKILKWYSSEARVLPWRGVSDPYAIWVSEIMLQQTRVKTVIPYFTRWMRQFPEIRSLAAASEQEALSLWEGLGYYSRARNLYKAAKIIMDKYKGELPHDIDALHKLPGIGKYTAGAIASIAFRKDIPILDGNLRRVLARVFDIAEPADTSACEKILLEIAETHLPKGRAGEYNQALMDLGATICVPRNPACFRCPLKILCKSHRLGIQEQRPVLKPKSKVPHYTVTAAVLVRDGKVLIAKRPSNGLLGGMWEFPGGKVEESETLETCLARELHEELGVEILVGKAFGIYQHAYTHYRITLHAFLCELIEGEPKPIEASALAWVAPSDLGNFPMGKVDRQIAGYLQ